MVGSIVSSIIIMLVGLFYLIPYLVNEQAKKDALQESQRLSSYIKMFRAYYNSDILSKIKKHTDLKVNFDHKTDDKTVPLPATVLHDMAEIFTKRDDIAVEIYSNFPFPNRESRVLDEFQKESLAFVSKNPEKIYSREDLIDSKAYYRTSFPDYLTANSCVNCHNSRADTPKDDWKLGDIRGVIEVSVPLKTASNSAKSITYSILIFILVNFSVLGIYYYLYMRRKNQKLKANFNATDKILSEYKRAVDLGAIVSKTDIRGKITYTNDAFVEISGYSREELIGKAHSLVKSPDTPKEIFKKMWGKILNKEVWQGDIKNRSKTGKDYYVFATIVPILDENDNIVEFLAIRYDTTNLHVALKEAERAEKVKGQFLANMSHELRTPLNAIIGFSQILQRRKSLDEKDRSYVDKINLSGQNLLTLVNSILDFSKMDEDEMEFSPSDVNIQNLFSEILIMFETALSDKKITISMFKYKIDEVLYADRQLLKQAFINLISNAIKFSYENTEIKITHEYVDNKNIFSVCDNGHGIEKNELKTLFTPFKQGENAKKNAATGTGLGLAITSKIIKDIHGGEIWVKSEIGKGTCFNIAL